MVGDYDFIKEGARVLCEIEDGTYELRLVPKRRRGRFKLSMGYLECDENVNKLIFERVLVSMCRVDYASATVKFEGCRWTSMWLEIPRRLQNICSHSHKRVPIQSTFPKSSE